MNEDNNIPQSTPREAEEPVTSQPLPPTDIPPTPEKPKMNRKKKILYSLAVLLVIVTTVVSWWLLRPTVDDATTATQTKKTVKPADDEVKTEDIDCGDRSGFADLSIGMKFCYPTDWGAPSVLDAKLDVADTGYRQVIKFADMPYVQIGGVSSDWTTTVGRGGMCFDPSNTYPELSSYNTEWHSQMGSGDSLEFATRALVSSGEGYAMTEEASNVMQSGVCARGIKAVNAPHYKYSSLSYYRDFDTASGVTTPAQHVASPNVLLSTQMRTDIDAVMNSMVKY